MPSMDDPCKQLTSDATDTPTSRVPVNMVPPSLQRTHRDQSKLETMASQIALNEAISHARDSPYFRALYSNVHLGSCLGEIPVTDPARVAELSRQSTRFVRVHSEEDEASSITKLNVTAPSGDIYKMCYTASELSRQVEILQTVFRNLYGLKAGDRVALSPALMWLFTPHPVVALALHTLHAHIMPLPPNAVAETGLILACSQSKALLTDLHDALPHIFTAMRATRTTTRPLQAVVTVGPTPSPGELETLSDVKVAAFPLGDAATGFFATPVSSEKLNVYEPVEDVEVEILGADGAAAADGRLVVTNFARRLTPVLRFPLPLRAQWVDKAARTFCVVDWAFYLPYSPPGVDVDLLYAKLRRVVGEDTSLALQAEITSGETEDQVTLRVAVRREIFAAMETAVPQIVNGAGMADALWRIEWAEVHELLLDPVTGDICPVLDQRALADGTLDEDDSDVVDGDSGSDSEGVIEVKEV